MSTKKDINFIFTLKNLFSGPAASIEQAFQKIRTGAKDAENEVKLLETYVGNLEDKLKEFKSKNKAGIFGNIFHGKSPIDNLFGSTNTERFEKGVDNIKKGLKSAAIASAAIDAGLVASIWSGIEFQRLLQKGQAGTGAIEKKVSLTDEQRAKLPDHGRSIDAKNKEIDRQSADQQYLEYKTKEYTNHPYTWNEKADAVATGLTSGLTRREMGDALKGILDFGTAAEIDAGEATRSIITISSQFAKELEGRFTKTEDRIQYASDILISAGHSDLAYPAELIESFKQSAPYFSQEGIPYTQAAALLSFYSNAKRGSESGTDAKNFLSYLNEIRIGKRGPKDVWAQAGVNPINIPRGDIVKTFNYLNDVLNKIHVRDTRGAENVNATKATRAVIAKEWFGDQGGNIFLFLRDRGIKGVEERRHHYEHAKGKAEEKAAEKMAGFQGAARLIKRDALDVFTAIGDHLMKLKPFGDFLGNIHGQMKDLMMAFAGQSGASEKMKGFVLGLKEGTMEALETLSSAFKTVMKLFGYDMGDKSGKAGKELGKLLAKILVFGSVIAPIGIVIAGAALLISAAFRPLIGLAQVLAGAGLGKLLAGTIGLFKNLFKDLFKVGITGKLGKGLLSKILLPLGKIFKYLFTGKIGAVIAGLSLLDAVFPNMWSDSKKMLESFFVTSSENNKKQGELPKEMTLEESLFNRKPLIFRNDLDTSEIKKTQKNDPGEIRVMFDNLPKNASVETFKKGFPEVIVDINKGGRWATA